MKNLICKLCTTTLDNCTNEFEILGELIKEILEVILLMPNFEQNEIPVVCKTCKENLHKSFDFKATCIYTEDCLYPYIKSSDEIDLKVVYFRERMIGKIFKFDKNDEVCRFCLSLTKSNTATALKCEILKYHKFFGMFMPELTLHATGEAAVICKRCHISLENHVKFINSCLYSENKVNEKGLKCSNLDNIGKIKLDKLESHPLEIEPESLHLKTEDGLEIIENSLKYIEEIKEEKSTEDYLPVAKLNNISAFEQEKMESISDTCNESALDEDVKNEENISNIFSDEIKNLCVTKVAYKAEEKVNRSKNELSCQSKIHKEIKVQIKLPKNKIESQNLTIKEASTVSLHKDSSDINIHEIYKCKICNFVTRYKERFNKHMFLHKDLSVNEMYTCETCNFITKHKEFLKNHMIIHTSASKNKKLKSVHKNPPRIEKHKREICNFMPKYKGYLKNHMLTHKDPSEIEIYKCSICNFVTTRKIYLNKHMIVHKDAPEIDTHKCKICHFVTKYKNSLKQHMLKHKDPSEIATYKCKLCHFVTKYKSSLDKHMLMHKDPSDIEIYMCNICTFKTKWKGYFKQHNMLMHKDPSKVEIYRCIICMYETKYKAYLSKHMLIHKDPSETEMYTCKLCNFATKHKLSLQNHELVHKDPSEIKMYKCKICNYMTKYKHSLKRHELVHKDPSEIEMYKCEKCNFVTKYKECLTKHVMLMHKDPSEIKIHKCKI